MQNLNARYCFITFLLFYNPATKRQVHNIIYLLRIHNIYMRVRFTRVYLNLAIKVTVNEFCATYEIRDICGWIL